MAVASATGCLGDGCGGKPQDGETCTVVESALEAHARNQDFGAWRSEGRNST